MSQPMGLPKLKRAMMKSSHMTKELTAMWSLTIETSLPLTRNARATSSALCLGLSALIQLKSSVLHKANSLRKKSSEVMPSSYSTSVMFQLSNWAALERSSATSWLTLSWFAMPSLSFGSLFTHSFWTAGSTPRSKQVKRWMSRWLTSLAGSRDCPTSKAWINLKSWPPPWQATSNESSIKLRRYSWVVSIAFHRVRLSASTLPSDHLETTRNC